MVISEERFIEIAVKMGYDADQAQELYDAKPANADPDEEECVKIIITYFKMMYSTNDLLGRLSKALTKKE